MHSAYWMNVPPLVKKEWAVLRPDCLPLFLLAASSVNDGIGDVPLDVVYHLVRRNMHGWVVF